MNSQNLLTKRNIIGLVITIILLIAIPLGIYLAQTTQIFKPRASTAVASFSGVTIAEGGLTEGQQLGPIKFDFTPAAGKNVGIALWRGISSPGQKCNPDGGCTAANFHHVDTAGTNKEGGWDQWEYTTNVPFLIEYTNGDITYQRTFESIKPTATVQVLDGNTPVSNLNSLVSGKDYTIKINAADNAAVTEPNIVMNSGEVNCNTAIFNIHIAAASGRADKNGEWIEADSGRCPENGSFTYTRTLKAPFYVEYSVADINKNTITGNLTGQVASGGGTTTDTTAPTTTITPSKTSGFTSGETVTLTFNGADNTGGSGIKHINTSIWSGVATKAEALARWPSEAQLTAAANFTAVSPGGTRTATVPFYAEAAAEDNSGNVQTPSVSFGAGVAGSGATGTLSAADCQISPSGSLTMSAGESKTFSATFTARNPSGNPVAGGPVGNIQVYRNDGSLLTDLSTFTQRSSIDSTFTPSTPGIYKVTCRAANNNDMECHGGSLGLSLIDPVVPHKINCPSAAVATITVSVANTADCSITSTVPTTMRTGESLPITASYSSTGGPGPFGEINIFSSGKTGLYDNFGVIAPPAGRPAQSLYMDVNGDNDFNASDRRTTSSAIFNPTVPGTYNITCRSTNGHNIECYPPNHKAAAGGTVACSAASVKTIQVTQAPPPPLAKPTALSATCKSDGTADLRWTGAGEATSYTVNIDNTASPQFDCLTASTSGSGDSCINTTTVPVNSNTAPNTAYRFSVIAKNAVSQSPASDNVSFNCPVSIPSPSPVVVASDQPSPSPSTPVVFVGFDEDNTPAFAVNNTDLSLPIRINTAITPTTYQISAIDTTIGYNRALFDYVSLEVKGDSGFSSTCTGQSARCRIEVNRTNGTVRLAVLVPIGGALVSGDPVIATLVLKPKQVSTVATTIDFRNTQIVGATPNVILTPQIRNAELTIRPSAPASVAIAFDTTDIPYATEGLDVTLPIRINTAITETIQNTTAFNLTLKYNKEFFDFVSLDVEPNSGLARNCTRTASGAGNTCKVLPNATNGTVQLITSLPAGNSLSGDPVIANLKLKAKKVTPAQTPTTIEFQEAKVTGTTPGLLGVETKNSTLEIKPRIFTTTYKICEANGNIEDTVIPSTANCQTEKPYRNFGTTGKVIAKDYEILDKTPGPKTIFVEFTASNGQKLVAKTLINYLPNPSITGENSGITCNFVGEGMEALIYGTNFYAKGSGSGVKINGQQAEIVEWKEDVPPPGSLPIAPVAATGIGSTASSGIGSTASTGIGSTALIAIASPSPVISSSNIDSAPKLWLVRAKINRSSKEIVPVELTTSNGSKVTGSCQVGVTALDFAVSSKCGPLPTNIKDDVEITIYENNPDATVVSKGKAKVDSKGKPLSLALPTLQRDKEYVLIVKSLKNLAKRVDFKTKTGTTVVDDLNMPVGNIAPANNPDSRINSLDRSELVKQWSLTSDVTKTGDFNEDGRINSIDWSCMRENFNKDDEVFRGTNR